MAKYRGFPAKCLVNRQLLRRVGNMIITAQNVRDFHHVVIDDNGKIICRHSVTLLNDKIAADRIRIETDVSFDNIVPFVNDVLRNANSDNRLQALGTCLVLLGLDFFFCHAFIFIFVARSLTARLLCFALFVQLIFGHE